jgi:hypothetical protein
MKLDKIIKTGLSRVEAVKVRTAINPLLWLSGCLMPFCFAGALLVPETVIKLAFLGLAAVPIFATLIAYFLFLFRDPDRLQSEQYLIKQQMIQLVRQHDDHIDEIDFTELYSPLEMVYPPESKP